MRFVRVPPYESGVKLTNFVFSCQNGEFWWGQKCCTHLLTQNEELSKKIGACIYVYTGSYTQIRDIGIFKFECWDIQISISGYSNLNIGIFKFEYWDIQM